MTVPEQSSPDDLAEALATVRTAIWMGEVPAVDASLPVVMAEFDRLRLVEQAATTLLARCDQIDAGTAYNNERFPDRPLELALSTAEVRIALAAAVRTETPGPITAAVLGRWDDTP
jgi:hypothetical protein